MIRKPNYWNKGKKILSKKDKIFKKIIKKFNKGFLTSKKDPFFSLCRTIVKETITAAKTNPLNNFTILPPVRF